MAYLGFENHVLTGTLTGGGTDIANLQSRIGADKWQTGVDVAGGAYFQIDSGSASTKWQAFGIFRTNFTTGASMVIKLGTTAGADDVYNSGTVSGVVAGRNMLLHVAAAEQTARYLRIELTDSSNPDTEIQVGLAYAGPLVSPTYGIAVGSAIGRQTETSETQTLGGQEFPILNFTRRFWNATFPAITDAEVESICDPIERYAATGENVLFIPFNDGTRMQSQSVYGRPANPRPIIIPNYNINEWTFSISDRL